MGKYISAYIDGTTNLRTYSFKDHASTDMHDRAMMLLKKDQGVDVREYALIVRAMSTMDKALTERTKKNFEIAF